jgi:hypothetical protein
MISWLLESGVFAEAKVWNQSGSQGMELSILTLTNKLAAAQCYSVAGIMKLADPSMQH